MYAYPLRNTNLTRNKNIINKMPFINGERFDHYFDERVLRNN